MKVHLDTIQHIHLEAVDELLSIQNTITLMALFGLLDAHGQYSLNDIQFTIFMSRMTDMKSEDIEKYFELMDYDFTGELLFPEFYFFMCCIISVKDGAQKEFLYRHLASLSAIIDDQCNKYLTIPQLDIMGDLMNWDIRTIKRIYECFDLEFDVLREKIYLNKMWFLIVTLIEDERALKAHQRIWACNKHHKNVIKALRDWVLIYLGYELLPPPLEITEVLENLPPLEVEISIDEVERKKKRQWWKTCLYIVLGFFYLTWKLAKRIYRSGLFHKIIREIWNILKFTPCKLLFRKICTGKYSEEDVSRFQLDSILNYGRKRTLLAKSKKIRKLEKIRKEKLKKRFVKDKQKTSKERLQAIKEKEMEKTAPEQIAVIKKAEKQAHEQTIKERNETHVANYKQFLRELYIEQQRLKNDKGLLSGSKSEPNLKSPTIIWTKPEKKYSEEI